MKALLPINTHNLALIFIFILTPSLCLVIMNTLSIIPIACGIVATFLYYISEKRLPPLNVKLGLFLIGFLLLASMSALWSEQPEFSLLRVFRLFSNFTAGYFLLSVLSALKEKQSLSAFFLIALVPFIIWLAYLFIEYNYFQIIYSYLKNIDHIQNVYITPARLNHIMIAAIAISWPLLCHLLFQKKKISMVILLSIILLISSQALSQSALLGMVCSLLVFITTYILSKKHVRDLFIAGIVFILIGFPLAISHLQQDFFYVDKNKTIFELSTMEKLIKTSSASERFQIWSFAIDHIKQSPIYGHGIEATRFIKMPEKGLIVEGKEWRSIMHPHNGILQLWIEFGIIGIVFVCAFFIFLLNQISKLPDYAFKAAISTFAALFVIGSVGYGLWQGWWIGTLFFSASYCSILTKIERNNLLYKPT